MDELLAQRTGNAVDHFDVAHTTDQLGADDLQSATPNNILARHVLGIEVQLLDSVLHEVNETIRGSDMRNTPSPNSCDQARGIRLRHNIWNQPFRHSWPWPPMLFS
ncbi:hypothetical protein ASD83_18285 [Devosia sp. Root685]|nr:hypothetical protein ASD83_18285 [Devosia sp. Root685]